MLLHRIWLTFAMSALFAALAVLAIRMSVAIAAEPHPALAAHLTPPASGPITVEFVVTDSANVMDIAGAWEVFQDTQVPERGASQDDQYPFRLYIVSDKKTPITLTGGMRVIPDYTFADAPPAQVIAIGAQGSTAIDKITAFLRARHAKGETVISVCTGAFKLGAAGLLDGKQATTHHDYLDAFHKKYPQVTLMPGNRYIQADTTIFTAGGLTSGIDLALHIVDLYFGSDVAAKTANYMEYSGQGWRAPQGASPVSD